MVVLVLNIYHFPTFFSPTLAPKRRPVLLNVRCGEGEEVEFHDDEDGRFGRVPASFSHEIIITSSRLLLVCSWTLVLGKRVRSRGKVGFSEPAILLVLQNPSNSQVGWGDSKRSTPLERLSTQQLGSAHPKLVERRAQRPLRSISRRT